MKWRIPILKALLNIFAKCLFQGLHICISILSIPESRVGSFSLELKQSKTPPGAPCWIIATLVRHYVFFNPSLRKSWDCPNIINHPVYFWLLSRLQCPSGYCLTLPDKRKSGLFFSFLHLALSETKHLRIKGVLFGQQGTLGVLTIISFKIYKSYIKKIWKGYLILK